MEMLLLASPHGSPQQMFTVSMAMPLDSIGAMRQDVVCHHREFPMDRDQTLLLTQQFIVETDWYMREAQADSERQKAAHKMTTAYGTTFSPRYSQRSREQKP